MTEILLAGGLIGFTGIIIGLLLGFAGKKFAVEVDEKEILVRNELPGNNCGGCGYAGCDALAKAIACGEAQVSACPVGGENVSNAIAQIMGVEAKSGPRMAAYVRCGGTCEKAKEKYEYFGEYDCAGACAVPGAGPKACSFGCLGFGSCVKACEFDAIHVVDGIAVVDKDKCKACGKCIAACPKGLITMLPVDAGYIVQCGSHDNAKTVMANCSVGCRGCTLCTRVCPTGAIYMDNGLAVIDQEKCTCCGACAQKCPAKCIIKQ